MNPLEIQLNSISGMTSNPTLHHSKKAYNETPPPNLKQNTVNLYGDSEEQPKSRILYSFVKTRPTEVITVLAGDDNDNCQISNSFYSSEGENSNAMNFIEANNDRTIEESLEVFGTDNPATLEMTITLELDKKDSYEIYADGRTE